jgi:single-stranded-DNA-specific exonuclease
MSKKWILRTPHPKLQAELSDALKIHPIIAQLLVNRGIMDVGEARSFLDPQLSGLHDPFLMKDMDKAVERVQLARDRNEKVMIYGDYDVDGVTSTAVLWRALKKLGLDVVNYIPHRVDEGYGLNHEIIPLAKEMGVSLLITVDCGITSSDEIAALSAEGVEVVILDHHEPDEQGVPEAVAVVDAKQKQNTYPFRDLAGVGLVAKFVQALTGQFPKEDLDLVTLGTIADVVPLRGENRIFARLGLPLITRTQKVGLRALIRSARIEGKEVSPHTVGFVLGPRINAAGRVGTANTSLDLLLAQDEVTSFSLACSLEAHNRERQRLQGEVVDEAVAVIEADRAFLDEKVIVVHGQGWHKGVLGIVASKIADKYGRPAIVISLEEGLGVGSARSVEGFHLHEALGRCSDVLVEFGGHKYAAGLKVREENLSEFRSRLNLLARDMIAEGQEPTLEIDSELALTEAELDLIKVLEVLEPHGEGNPEPVFVTRRLMVKSRPQVMGRDTIKFWVTDGRVTKQAVGFGMGEDCKHLRQGQAVDIAYSLSIDDWNKSPQAQLTLKDVKVLMK